MVNVLSSFKDINTIIIKASKFQTMHWNNQTEIIRLGTFQGEKIRSRLAHNHRTWLPRWHRHQCIYLYTRILYWSSYLMKMSIGGLILGKLYCCSSFFYRILSWSLALFIRFMLRAVGYSCILPSLFWRNSLLRWKKLGGLWDLTGAHHLNFVIIVDLFTFSDKKERRRVVVVLWRPTGTNREPAVSSSF
jgi:hypothetical protein